MWTLLLIWNSLLCFSHSIYIYICVTFIIRWPGIGNFLNLFLFLLIVSLAQPFALGNRSIRRKPIQYECCIYISIIYCIYYMYVIYIIYNTIENKYLYIQRSGSSFPLKCILDSLFRIWWTDRDVDLNRQACLPQWIKNRLLCFV